MNALNYDVNKLPLGKLSKSTIMRGYQALKDLSNLLNDATLAQSQYGESNFPEQFSSLRSFASTLHFSGILLRPCFNSQFFPVDDTDPEILM